MNKLESVEQCLVCESKDAQVIETTGTMMDDSNETWHFLQCANCKMVYLSPRVKPEYLDTYYTEAYLPYRGSKAWGKYADLVEGDQQKIDQKRLKLVQDHLPDSATSILDIGCGKPTFLKLVQEKTELKTTGIDFSDHGWKGIAAYQDIDLHVATPQNIPDHIAADVITMWHYLEHDYQPRKTLRSLHESQKDNATLIIEVPNYDSYTRKKFGKHWSGYHTPRHTGLYTPETIQKLLNTTGWEVVNIYTYGSLDPYTLDWMSRMEKLGIDWTASMEKYFVGYVIGKLIRPHYFFDRSKSLGFMTAIARKR